jgi:hypothetical protein
MSTTDDDDGGLPEESSGKLEQTSTVNINPRAPWKIDGRSVVQNYDDLLEFGQDIFSAARTASPTTKVVTVIVIDNDSNTQHYPNNKHFWNGSYYKGQEDAGLIWKPFTEFFIDLRDAGNPRVLDIIQNTFINRYNGVALGSYQGIPIVVPDPNIDHTRPIVQAEATTSTTTGVTVITKTTADPKAAGVVTESETVPAAVTTSGTLTEEQRKWLGNADPTDPYILARMRAATGSGSSQGAGPLASLLAAVKATTGVNPCLPNNPPASAGVSGSGATPPAAVPYDDAILRQARAAAASAGSTYDDGPLRAVRAAAAAPASTYDDGPLRAVRAAASGSSAAAAASAGGSAAAAAAATRGSAAAAAAASSTAPTTVTQQPSTPTSSSQIPGAAQSTVRPRPPNVYVYEPLTPGFDRYDFNSGKKVFTPNSGPSRTASNQPVTSSPAPRVPPGANRDPNQTGPQ